MAFQLSWEGTQLANFSGRDQEVANRAGLVNSESEAEEELDDGNSDTRDQPPKTPKSTQTRRIPGGTTTIPKKLTLDYDSDDARLIELKKEGQTDDYVSKKFEEEGRMQYAPKTLSSRWIRLRKLLLQQEDDRLDDELSDWHEGEDDVLDEIAKAVAPKFDHQIKLLEQRRWHEISMHLAEKLGKRKYTGKACRERAEDVANGTALPPIELAENPDERRQMREGRIAAATKARQDARDEQRAKEQRAEARSATKKRDAADSTQKKINNALQRRAEKEEAERIKEERAEQKAKMKQHRITMLAEFRAEKEWVKTRKQAERELYRHLTGYNIDGKRTGRFRKDKNGYESEEAEESETFESDDDEDIINLAEDDETDEDAPAEIDDFDNSAEEDTPLAKIKKPSIAPKAAGNVRAAVTPSTLRNPRSIMTDDELVRLLYYRGLARRGQDESHAEVVARIAASDESLKSEELSQLLIHLSEKSKGKKPEKITRLQEADAKACDAGLLGVKSTDTEFVQRYEGYQGEFEYLVKEAEGETVPSQDAMEEE